MMIESNTLPPVPEGSIVISFYEALVAVLCPVAFSRFAASPACLLAQKRVQLQQTQHCWRIVGETDYPTKQGARECW